MKETDVINNGHYSKLVLKAVFYMGIDNANVCLNEINFPLVYPLSKTLDAQ